MRKSTLSKVRALIGVILFACLSMAAGGSVYAESLGNEGGFVYPATYSVGKGGSVTMFIHASDDLVITGADTDLFTSGLQVTGFAAGEYPDDENAKIIVTKGHISLERIEIVPDDGYIIDNVMIREGADGIWVYKDKIASYTFGDGANAFIVIFRPITSSQVSSSQLPSSTQAVSDISEPATGGFKKSALLLIWLLPAILVILVFTAIMTYILKHRKIRGKSLK